MARARSVAGGGRAVELTPERLEGWFTRFGERHGGITSTTIGAYELHVVAADRATATVVVPFGPLSVDAIMIDDGEAVAMATGRARVSRTTPVGSEHSALWLRPLLAHLYVPRRIGLVLVRLGAHSVGVAENGRVVVSATDRHLVHGRSAAGGWSQQRFARRREGQARRAIAAAVTDTVRVLLPRVTELDGVLLGGDRRALEMLRAEPKLAPLMALAAERVLDLGEPRRSVLDEAAARARAVEVVVQEPSSDTP